jgi:hypothetical protein
MRYILILLVLAGCNPQLTQHSLAPPGRQARLDAVHGFWGVQHYRLNISEGVALAMTCEKTGPCENLNVISANPAIAEVRSASLSKLERVGTVNPTQTPAAAFVIVGKSPGKTRVHIKSREGERNIIVNVIAAPSPAPAVSKH